MRRAFAAIALALLAGVVLATGTGRTLGQAHAATGACVKHTKRIVRRVSRHGRRVRIVRPRHFWTCEEAPAPGASPASTSAPAAPSTPARPSAPAPPSTPAPIAASPIPAPVIEVPKIEVPAQPEPEANALGVAAEDGAALRFSLTRQTVKPGRLLVQLDNRGEDPHAMDMQRIGPGETLEGPVVAALAAEPGEASAPATVEVQPGRYLMWCPIGHHAEHGMKAEVLVE